MRFERFRKIVEHNRRSQKEMTRNVQELYRRMHLNYERDVLDLEFIIKPLFEQEEYLILEMPFRDKEIGAICYKGEHYGYIFLNSAVPKVNVNFALGHEIYHVFYQSKAVKQRVEFYLSEYYEKDEEELSANLFSGMLLMPEASFVSKFHGFQAEQTSVDTEFTTVIKLMSYFEVPYMAVVIRCYELGLLPEGQVLQSLLEASETEVKAEFERMWLDRRILEPTYRDNYPRLEQIVRNVGESCSEKGMLSTSAVSKALRNIDKIYHEIRGEYHGAGQV